MISFALKFGGPLVLATVASVSVSPGLGTPWEKFQDDFTKTAGCHWTGTDTEAVCQLEPMRGNIEVRRNHGSKEPNTIEINPIISDHRSEHSAEKFGQTTALEVLTYVLPNWRNGPSWLRKALNSAKSPGARNVIRIGSVTVLVRHQQPADLDDTYADVVITTQKSLKEWNYDDPS